MTKISRPAAAQPVELRVTGADVPRPVLAMIMLPRPVLAMIMLLPPGDRG